MLLSAWRDAGWEINLIRSLQKISNGFTDVLFKGITFLGDEVVFILIAAAIYWCIDKKFGYKFMFAYIGSALTVGVVKNFVARERPYFYEHLGIRSIGSKTDGFSFPSGHSQSIAAETGLLSEKYGSRKRWWVYPVSAVIILLVMFSRMYLGQHFLSDVLVGALTGITVALLLGFLFDLMGDREEYFSLILIPVLIIMLIIQGRGEYTKVKDLYVVTAAFIAVSSGYLIEKKFIRYEVRGTRWWIRLIQFAGALLVAVAFKEGLKAIFPKQNLLCDFIRYFLMSFWAACGAPAVFKYTSRFWNKKFPPGKLNEGGADKPEEEIKQPE